VARSALQLGERAGSVATRVEETQDRITAKRLLPAAGECARHAAECSISGEVRAPRSRLHVDSGELLRYLEERVSISRRTTRSISA
jgi:hypothetical protein